MERVPKTRPARPRAPPARLSGTRRPWMPRSPSSPCRTSAARWPRWTRGGADLDEAFFRHIAGAPAVSSERAGAAVDAGGPGAGAAPAPLAAGATDPAADAARPESVAAPAPAPPPPDEAAAPRPEFADGGRDDGESAPLVSSGPAGPAGTAAPAAGIAFDDALLRDIAAAPSISSDRAGASTPESGAAPAPASDDEEDDDGYLEDGADASPAPAALPAFDEAPLDAFDTQTPAPTPAPAPTPTPAPMSTPASTPAPGAAADAEYADVPLEAVHADPAAALAFATDPDTEVALRDGLFGYESAAPGCGDPQVWQGGLRAAIAALGDGYSAQLVFVDIDGIPYPAGAIHELAAVCEVGTVVIAVGSDVSARPGRELLLAGVSDYLAKPLTAEAVRAVAERAATDAAGSRPGGCVAGFVGSGGSGTTTLTAAAALHAAAHGCYVSVLDLNRSVAAAALALGVEPAAGLDQLLETTARTTPEPEMVEGVCARRSDRIEVFAHRWSQSPPPVPAPEALDCLLASLRHRSQLVLVDGLDEPAMRFIPSAEVDTRVFVAEPTVGKAAHLARMVERLGADRPLLFVQNHTRAFRRGRSTRVLRNAGIGLEPDVVVPFEPVLPESADRGWPQGRLPRSLRKPLEALTERLMGPPGAGAAASPRPSRGP